MDIKCYTKERIPDVIQFEKELRREEDIWGWDIGEKYCSDVENSFSDSRFKDSLSLLAYEEGRVVGRIDSTLICSHFDGSVKAYLDWICVLKSFRHSGIAQELMKTLRHELKERYQVDTLIGLIASNEEAQHFYRNLEHVKIRDEGIWIDIV